jgi:predicted Zn-dependent protease
VNILIILACCGVLAVSCTTDYVTGKKTFSLVSESQEVAMGKEADPQIVAQYGLYDDEELSVFIDNLGQALARKSHRPQLDYTFRVLDSEIVNAFALPGGYVYVTRGILAHFNSEDELAGVLGHEIGHVVARHGAEQMSRQQLAGLGLGLGAAVLKDLEEFAEAAGFGVQLLLLRYSRGQESESDRLGVEYSTRLGYDSHRMATFFQTLKRMSEQSGQSLPSFMSTHPDPGDRETTVHALTEEWQSKVNYTPLNKNPDDYLKMIDGIVFGPDPRQGYVDNGMFYHPSLVFQFPVPNDWRLMNTPHAVFMVSPDEKAIIQMTLTEAPSAVEAGAEFVKKNGVTVTSKRSKMLNGFPAYILVSDQTGEDGSIKILSYFIERDERIYVFHGYCNPADFDANVGSFESVMGGYATVTDADVLNVKPRRLRVRQAPRGGSMSSVLAALGVEQGDVGEFSVINGRRPEDIVEKGTLIKVVGE